MADAGAVAACMAYVDLNPVRAGLAETLPIRCAHFPSAGQASEGDFCGAGDRLRARRGRAELAAWEASGKEEATATEAQKCLLEQARSDVERARWLAPVDVSEGGMLGMSEERYVQLVDWTGRRLRDDKAGAIPADLAPVLERLELDVENWVSTVERYGSLYHRVAGPSFALRATEGRLETVREAAKRAGPSFALRATEGRQRWFRRANREACARVYPVARENAGPERRNLKGLKGAGGAAFSNLNFSVFPRFGRATS